MSPKHNLETTLNIIVLGHNSSGKTMLAEEILVLGKALKQAGSTKDGTSTLCTDQEEKKRQSTLLLDIGFCERGNHLINVFDTPGYLELSGHVSSGLYVADLAIICVDSSSGVTVSTRKFWNLAENAGVPKIVALTKFDISQTSFQGVVKCLKDDLSNKCIPVLFPDGSGAAFTKAVPFWNNSVPADLASLASQAKEKVIEVDDKLLEKYLEGTEVSEDEVKGALAKAISCGSIVPVIPCNSTTGLGIVELLDILLAGYNYRNIPDSIKPLVDKCSVVARVFKCNSDRFVGKILYLKVFKGTLRPGDTVYNVRTAANCKLGSMFKPFGSEQRSVSEIGSGDIVAVTKIEDMCISDVLTDKRVEDTVAPINFPRPVISLAVEPKSKKDESKLSISLQKMSDADPTFIATRDQRTHELVISGLGQLHLDITLSRMKNIFEAEVVTKAPKIPFNETCFAKAEGHHKHKKQTGGRGQYGEVYLTVEPAQRGEGFIFQNAITQGKIPSQYIPSIEKGIKNTLEKGVIAGYPVVDVKVTVYDGSFHEVDSDNNSFELAGSKAFKDGFLKAKPVILEPIVNMDVTVPAKFIGDIQGQIISKRGRIQTVEGEGRLQVIKAQVPLMEVLSYATELTAITAGEGSFSMEVSHYDVLPNQIAEKVKAAAIKEKEDE